MITVLNNILVAKTVGNIQSQLQRLDFSIVMEKSTKVLASNCFGKKSLDFLSFFWWLDEPPQKLFETDLIYFFSIEYLK